MNTEFSIASVVIRELYRRKDFYVLFILTALLTLGAGSISFFNDEKIVRYIRELCLALIWLSVLVIAVVTTARQMPAERESRTIFPLLAKPVSRGQLLRGKFLGCWFASGLALLVFYLFFGLVSFTRNSDWSLGLYMQALWMHWMLLGIVVALSLLGSVLFSAVSANVTIVFLVVVGILFVGRHLNAVALQLSEPTQSLVYGIYFVIPHLEFFDLRELLVHGIGPIPWWFISTNTLYAAVYAIIFLLAAWIVFRKQSLN